ncbi:hypothetical protein Tco_0849272, partial [Tanacetum coccineum]
MSSAHCAVAGQQTYTMSDLGCCRFGGVTDWYQSQGYREPAFMSSASSAVIYTSVYTDSEPGRVFWGADEEVSDGALHRNNNRDSEEPQTPPVPQDEDEREPMFIQPHDPDYNLEEDPEEYEDDETEDGLVDYPMDGGEDGDDDDGDSSRDDVDDEDEDEEDEDEEDEEEEEENLALVDSAVVVPTVELVSSPKGTELIIPPPSTDITTTGARITVRLQASIFLPPEAEVERLLALPTPPPSPPISLSPPSAGERLARCMAIPTHSSPPPALINAVTAALPSPPLPLLPPSIYIPPPVDYRDDILESEQPPRKRSCLFALGFRYEIGEISTARPTGGRGEDY